MYCIGSWGTKLVRISVLAISLCVGTSAHAQWEPFDTWIRPWSHGTKAATLAQRFGWCIDVGRRGTGSRLRIITSDAGSEYVGYTSFFEPGASPFPCSEEIAWQYQTLLVFDFSSIPQPAIVERAVLTFRKGPVPLFDNTGDCNFRLDLLDGPVVIGDEVADNAISRARLPLLTTRLSGNDQWRWSGRGREETVRLQIRTTVQRFVNGYRGNSLVLGPNLKALHLRDNRDCVNSVRHFRLYVKGIHRPR